MSRGNVETIVSKERTHLATTERGGDAKGGPSRKRSDQKARNNFEAEEAESQQQGASVVLRLHHATPRTISEELAAVRKAREVENLHAWMNSRKPKG